MKLRIFAITILILSLSLPLSCESQSTTSGLLEEAYKFSIEHNENKFAKIQQNLLKAFNQFYNELEAEEDRAPWDFEFQYNPFLDKKNFKEVQRDPEIQRYVQHLKEYREKKQDEFHNAIRAKKNPLEKLPRSAKRFKEENPQWVTTIETVDTIILLFEVPSIDRFIRYTKNNPKITVGVALISLIILIRRCWKN